MDLQTIGISLGGSATVAFAIVKTLVRAEARKEVAPDIEKLHGRANIIEKDFVRCEFCKLQHDNLTKTLQSMDTKLDTLKAKL